MNTREQFIDILTQSLAANTFVKVSFANYKGSTEGLKNCYIKKIRLKLEEKLSFTFRYKTKDIVKNYTEKEAIKLISDLINENEFRLSSLFTTESDVVLEYTAKNNISLKKNKATYTELPSLDHNVQKNRILKAEGKNYLHKLNITDEKGVVNKTAQDKFKQINRYVELLSPLIKNIPKREVLNVTDMGAGKGYLTFALYDYISSVLQQKAKVTGVEFRKDLVDLCNDISKQSNFEGLNFVEGTINNFEAKGTNVLIALHACDTATDDAIYKGITSGAELIVVAPCCHKQIRREIEKHKTKNDLDFLVKHGIFMERQAEMLTDGIRSLLLEYSGYSTKIFEFISDVHTPKNIMIVAEKKPKAAKQKQEILEKIKQTKAYFGIDFHYLEKLMNLV